MTNIAPTAQRGDICVLLEPSLPERVRLRRYQRRLKAIFGGKPCKIPHVTCQRFALVDHSDVPSVINALQEEFSPLSTFPLFADSLISFYADFRHDTVLRWKIQNTVDWECFKRTVENTLTSQGCPLHYPPAQAITATALENICEVDITSISSELSFPCFLFNVQHIVLSQIQEANRFNILARFNLKCTDSDAIKNPAHFGLPG